MSKHGGKKLKITLAGRHKNGRGGEGKEEKNANGNVSPFLPSPTP